MKIKEILAKVTKGEALTDAEKDFLTKYEEPKPDTSKVTQLEADKAALAQKVADLEAEKETEANKGKPEVDQLKAEIVKKDQKIATLEKERDTVKTEKADLERDNSIRTIAAENRFKNFEYLKFNLAGAKVDLANKDAVKAHMDQLRKDSPEFFTAEVNGGGGGSNAGNGGGGSGTNQVKAYTDAKASGNFADMVANAPILK